MKRIALLFLALTFASLHAAAVPETDAHTILLWPDGAPGALGNAAEDRPSLSIFLPAKARMIGTGVVICPGGGYHNLAFDHEGIQIARWFNNLGVSAFVLKYRLGPKYHHPVMLEDAQRALRIVRSRAQEFGVAPGRIGIMGFSAGGHLASTAATHFDKGNPSAADPIDRAGSRPDFLILGYPVITMLPPYVHEGSRRNLLGDHPSDELVRNLSNELQVTADTPPTFIFQTDEDKTVAPENSVMFYLALRKAGVPAEMHIFQHGQHGLGFAPNDPELSIWPTLLKDWLQLRGLLNKIASQ